jgi:catechol-2,3-dioxygenase
MKIKEVILRTSHIGRLKDFYNRVLEFPILSGSEKAVSFQCGDSILTFTEDLQVINPYYHFAFNISENKLELALQYLQQRNVMINQIDGCDYFHSRIVLRLNLFLSIMDIKLLSRRL